MSKKQIVKVILLLGSLIVIYYSYYYLPNQNKGFVKMDQIIEVPKKSSDPKSKTTFINTEYKTENNKGQIYTTTAKASYFYQEDTGLIYLEEPRSFTKLNKDGSLIEIQSLKGIYNKNKNETFYEQNVIIKNKNYLITASTAQHISNKNLIIIDGNVIMKDLTMGLSHILYCDTVEVDTLTNNTIAFMKSKSAKVLAKKFK